MVDYSKTVDSAFDILRESLKPIVERVLPTIFTAAWREKFDWDERHQRYRFPRSTDGSVRWDVYALLDTVIVNARPFRREVPELGNGGIACVSWIKEFRDSVDAHKWANNPVPLDQVVRLLDHIHDLLSRCGCTTEASLIDQLRIPRLKAQLHSRNLNDMPIDEQLLRLGSKPHPLYSRARFFANGIRHAVIDDIVSIHGLWGTEGLPQEKIETSIIPGSPNLPDYVYHRRKATEPPRRNNHIVYLVDWEPALIDAGGILTMRFQVMDWHFQMAIEGCTDALHEEMIKGLYTQLGTFPGHMTCAVTVETQDGHLILCLRTEKVHNEPGEWSVGIGETTDADKDVRNSSAPHPYYTVVRGLEEELGLSKKVSNAAEVSFLNLGFSVRNFAYNLFCHARVPASSKEVIQLARKCAKANEHRDYEAVDFTLDRCVDLIIADSYVGGSGGLDVPHPLASWSRMCLLFAALKQFDIWDVQKALGDRRTASVTFG